MKKCSDQISKSLFLVDPTLSQALLKIRDLCVISEQTRFIEMNLIEPARYEDYRHIQDNYRLQVTEAQLDSLDNQVKDQLVENCRRSLLNFKEENRIPVKGEFGNVTKSDEQPPLLVGDETGKEMPFTQEATIRTHNNKLYRFVKLVDYVVLRSKIVMVNRSTRKIVKFINDQNRLLAELQD